MNTPHPNTLRRGCVQVVPPLDHDAFWRGPGLLASAKPYLFHLIQAANNGEILSRKELARRVGVTPKSVRHVLSVDKPLITLLRDDLDGGLMLREDWPDLLDDMARKANVDGRTTQEHHDYQVAYAAWRADRTTYAQANGVPLRTAEGCPVVEDGPYAQVDDLDGTYRVLKRILVEDLPDEFVVGPITLAFRQAGRTRRLVYGPDGPREVHLEPVFH